MLIGHISEQTKEWAYCEAKKKKKEPAYCWKVSLLVLWRIYYLNKKLKMFGWNSIYLYDEIYKHWFTPKDPKKSSMHNLLFGFC